MGRIDPGGSSDIAAWKKLKIQSGGNAMNLTSDRSAHRLDSNSANDTPIRVQMKKIEAVKVGLTFDDWARLMKVQFGIFRQTESDQLRPDFRQNRGLVKMTPSIQNRISKNAHFVLYKKNIKKGVVGHQPRHPNSQPNPHKIKIK